MAWNQSDSVARYTSSLKIGDIVVQQFSEQLKFLRTSEHRYRLSRWSDGKFRFVGGGVKSGDSFMSNYAQDTFAVTEQGYMQTPDILVRVGTLTAADGTVTFYRATLVRQP
jgi:hypothetical protein